MSGAPVASVTFDYLPHSAVNVELIISAPFKDPVVFERIVDQAVAIVAARQGEVD